MRQFSKKINLYSMIKSYFSIFLMFILYTFGYSATAGAEEFINSIMSFSPEIKILSITGTLLLFLILIYEKLSNQENSSQNSSSSIGGNTFTASDVPLSTLVAGTELPDYNPSALMNSQSISTSLVSSLINNNVLSVNPLELDPHHLPKLELYGQEDKFSILKQIPVTLFCTLIAGIAILSCGFVIDTLIKSQRLLTSILEFTNGISSFLGISGSALLAIAFVPMVTLTIFSILSKSLINTKDNKGHILDKSKSVEIMRVNGVVELKTKAIILHRNNCESNDWRKDFTNPFSENYNSQQKQNCNNDQKNDRTNLSSGGNQKVDNKDWRQDTTNPFSENYNCTNLTIERFLYEAEKALG